jgi:O-antigen/teichoic acid export membrane protein
MWRLWRPVLRWERRVRGPLVRTSLAIAVVSTVGILHFRGDIVLLSLLAPPEDVGVYTLASQFISEAFILPGFLMAAVFPILTRAIHGAGKIDEVINRTLQVLALASVAVGLAVVTLARPAVDIVAGAEFEAAVRPSRILALSIPFIFCAPVFFNIAIAVNRQRWLFWAGLATLGLNVLLNLILIPLFSYNGAAAATVVSEAVSFAGSLLIARRFVDFEIDAHVLIRIATSSILGTMAAVVVLRYSDVAAFVVAELALLAAAGMTHALRMEDARLLLRRERAQARG